MTNVVSTPTKTPPQMINLIPPGYTVETHPYKIGDRIQARGKTGKVNTQNGDLGTVTGLYPNGVIAHWDTAVTFGAARLALNQWAALLTEIEPAPTGAPQPAQATTPGK